MSVIKPSNNPIPFGQSGLTNTIPKTTVALGKASFTSGFPAITMAQKALGGLAPDGKDINGILNHVDQHIVWQTAGGRYQYDAAFVAAVGGYPLYAEIQSDDGLTTYINTLLGNTSNPNTGGANWVIKSGGSISSGLSTTQSVVSAVSSGLSSTNNVVSSVSSGLSGTNSIVSSVSSGLSSSNTVTSSISGGLSTTTSSVSAVSSGLSGVSTGLSSTNSSVSAVSSGLSSVSSGLSSTQSSVSLISSSLSTNTSAISSISSGLSITQSVVSSLSTGIGYRTGQGASVTQLTSKSTAVTMNALTGQITTNNSNLSANSTVAFTLNNSFITATDIPMVVVANGATSLTYHVDASNPTAGACTINIRNFSGSGQSDAIVLNFILFKGANS